MAPSRLVGRVAPSRLVRRVLAAALVVGGVSVFGTAAAYAQSAISVSPSSGLTGGKNVTVSGSGLAADVPGYVLECNTAPGEPSIYIGPPFDKSVPIGCSAPSLKRIIRTTSDGTLAVTFRVHEGRKLGPPCGPPPVIGGCGGLDSVGKHPRKDAQNYPCPPSPQQQEAGVTCVLMWIDTAGDSPRAQISFLGPGVPAPPTTAPPSTGTTAPGSTATTAPSHGSSPTPSTVPVTKALTGSGGSPGGSGSGSGSAGATNPATAAAGTTSTGPASAVSAGAGSLAFTGLGPYGKLIAAGGALLVLLGVLLFLVDLRRLASWLLGL